MFQSDKPLKSDTKAVIWDLDGVLYRYSDDFNDRCHKAAAKTAIEMRLNVTPAEALDIAERSYAKTGSSVLAFVREHKLDTLTFHRRYHDHIDISHFPLDFELMTKMERLPVTHSIITHGSSDWARRVVNQKGVGSSFKDDNIIGMEKTGFISKAESTKPFELVLEKLGVTPEQTIMLEDSPSNLVHAKHLGITTVLIHHGQEHKKHSHVDHYYDSPHRLLDDVYASIRSTPGSARSP